MRFLLLTLLSLTMFAGCLSGSEGPSTQSESGGTLYTGRFWTAAEPAFAAAMLVLDGRIVAVGDTADLRALGPEEEVALDGLVVPGFHDTHNHLLDWVTGDVQGSLFSDDPSAASPTTFDPTTGPVNQQPTATIHVCHWGVQHAESAGESVVGRLPIQESALFGPNLARDACYAGVAPQDEAGRAARLEQAQAIAASFGLTSQAQAGADHDLVDWLWAQESAGALSQRWHVYLWPESIEHAAAEGWMTGTGTDHAKVLGAKIYADGWLGPRTAALHDHFEDRPHDGFQFYEPDELDALVARARAAGLKVTAHAIGERAVDAVMDAYQRAEGVTCIGPTCGDPRYSIEHASLMSPGAIDRMAALGLAPSLQLSFPTSDAHWIEDALGDRSERAYPWRSMAEAGLRMGGSSDWPIEALPPLWGVERAVTRQEVDGSLPSAWMPEEAVDLETALRMVTIDAAYVLFQDDVTGSLEAGKFADFVVLGEDLFAIEPDAIAEVPVTATYLAGQRIH